MYAMNIQNDVIGLVLREKCNSKQVTDFIAWPSRCHDTIYIHFGCASGNIDPKPEMSHYITCLIAE